MKGFIKKAPFNIKLKRCLLIMARGLLTGFPALRKDSFSGSLGKLSL
jgi:hypothetical protein